MASHRPFRGLLAALLIIGGQGRAGAQAIEIDCAPPRGVSASSDVAAIIADGERDCERALEMVREGVDWRKRSDTLRRESDQFRDQAVDLREDAATYRNDVETYRRRLVDLQNEVAQLNAQRTRLENEAAGNQPAGGGVREYGRDSLLTVPIPGARAWEERLAELIRARLRYIETRLNALEDEIMTLQGVIQVGVDVAADREASAVDFEQLAVNNERVAIESDAAASLAEEAARVGERSAILHHMHACTQYISLHLDDPDAKRDVSRAIGYVDKYKHLLSDLDAAEAERLVGEARVAFDL